MGIIHRFTRLITDPVHRAIVLRQRFRRAWHYVLPSIPVPTRLAQGVWWLTERDYCGGVIFDGTFEVAESNFVTNLLKPGMTVIDAGAHHGYYTLLASKLVGPAGRVFAFEPSERERQKLTRHIKLNHCTNVSVIPKALGAGDDRMPLYIAPRAGSGGNSLRQQGAGTPVDVAVTSIDHYLARNAVGTVDFLKLDVEGGELDVLRGAQNLLANPGAPVVMAEVQDIRSAAWGYPAREVVLFLERFDYRWHEIHRDGSLHPISPSEQYDGNFVALPPHRATIE